MGLLFFFAVPWRDWWGPTALYIYIYIHVYEPTKKKKRESSIRERTKEQTNEALVQHTMRTAEAGQIGARQLSNVAYGAAHCGSGGLLVLLFAALARAAERRLSEFNAQEFANTSWAYATVSHRH